MNKLLSKINNSNIAIALAIAIFFIVDRSLKISALAAGSTIENIIGDFFSWHFTANYYMAFSLPLGGIILNSLVALVVLYITVHTIKLVMDNKKLTMEISCWLFVIAGALSNLFDRLSYGYVIDYWELRYFTVFNLADVVITIGAILLIWRQLRSK